MAAKLETLSSQSELCKLILRLGRFNSEYSISLERYIFECIVIDIFYSYKCLIPTYRPVKSLY